MASKGPVIIGFNAARSWTPGTHTHCRSPGRGACVRRGDQTFNYTDHPTEVNHYVPLAARLEQTTASFLLSLHFCCMLHLGTIAKIAVKICIHVYLALVLILSWLRWVIKCEIWGFWGISLVDGWADHMLGNKRVANDVWKSCYRAATERCN